MKKYSITAIRREMNELKKNANLDSVSTLVMIHYDEIAQEWIISETQAIGQGKQQRFKEKKRREKHLQDYCFRLGCDDHVILDAFGNPDPGIHENLYVFDVEDLFDEVEAGECKAFCIESITNPGTKDHSVEVTIKGCA